MCMYVCMLVVFRTYFECKRNVCVRACVCDRSLTSGRDYACAVLTLGGILVYSAYFVHLLGCFSTMLLTTTLHDTDA